ncbi:hypothetical protein PPGU16_31760 [Paraburkholderia largidicola]|uniref:Uncharacterized protein n=1 Tax=Paraburkholderia largidicola TaxID=3014751 RepID=A0A7I8BP78_9BURK|nr:hypothetical protein PPGU16_31760 [Paraburkholderia sp. PGU16]
MAALEALDWDTILQRAAESAAGGIAAGVVKTLLGPTEWERQISADLQTIIGKLDVILDEIRELRKYIRDANRANTRAALQADLVGPISTLTDYMVGIRHAKKLDPRLRSLFELATNDLTLGLSRVINYQEPDSARPLGIPLYASIEAGLIMLVIAHNVLEIPKATTRAQIETYAKTFAEWRSILKADADGLLVTVNAETAYLTSYPHRGALEIGGLHGNSQFDCTGRQYDPREGGNTLVFGVIDGGVDKPFVIVRMDLEPYTVENLEKADRFPFPWSVSGVGCGGLAVWAMVAGASGAYGRTQVMVRGLNTRRDTLLENAEQLRKLLLVIDSLGSAPVRLGKLLQ